MAIEVKTGRVAWTRQVTSGDAYNSSCGDKGPNCPQENGPDFDFGSSALLVRSAGGRDLVLAGQKSGVVTAFDPDRQGEIVWQTRVGQGGVTGGVQWGMASDGRPCLCSRLGCRPSKENQRRFAGSPASWSRSRGRRRTCRAQPRDR